MEITAHWPSIFGKSAGAGRSQQTARDTAVRRCTKRGVPRLQALSAPTGRRRRSGRATTRWWRGTSPSWYGLRSHIGASACRLKTSFRRGTWASSRQSASSTPSGEFRSPPTRRAGSGRRSAVRSRSRAGRFGFPWMCWGCGDGRRACWTTSNRRPTINAAAPATMSHRRWRIAPVHLAFRRTVSEPRYGASRTSSLSMHPLARKANRCARPSRTWSSPIPWSALGSPSSDPSSMLLSPSYRIVYDT